MSLYSRSSRSGRWVVLGSLGLIAAMYVAQRKSALERGGWMYDPSKYGVKAS